MKKIIVFCAVCAMVFAVSSCKNNKAPKEAEECTEVTTKCGQEGECCKAQLPECCKEGAECCEEGAECCKPEAEECCKEAAKECCKEAK